MKQSEAWVAWIRACKMVSSSTVCPFLQLPTLSPSPSHQQCTNGSTLSLFCHIWISFLLIHLSFSILSILVFPAALPQQPLLSVPYYQPSPVHLGVAPNLHTQLCRHSYLLGHTTSYCIQSRKLHDSFVPWKIIPLQGHR